MTPDVAVVILNWNGRAFLEQFLANVVSNSQPYRVVLADNASTDDSLAWTKAHFPDMEIVVNTENGGFAKGYNDALKRIQADYYVLLNSDVEVTPNWLEPLLQTMKDPKVAACQPKVLAYHQKDQFEHAGASGGFIDKYQYPFCRGRLMHVVENDQHQYDYPTSVFWTTGACMLIRSNVYHEMDGLDERFFAHMEEIDLCWRMQRAGHQLMAIPQSTVYHVGGGTLAYQSPRKTFLNFRNSLLMIHKNHPGWVFGVIFRRLCLDGLAGIMFTLKGEFAHTKAIIQAHFSFYRMLSSSRVERNKWKHLPHKATQGVYKGSILWAFYAQKIRAFKDLNQRRFH